jgi:Bacterial SH3 domain
MKSGKVAACAAALTFALLALSAEYAAAQSADPGAPAGAAPPNAGPPGDANPPAGAPPPAVAGTNVNLRQGPGTTYTVITTVPAGAPLQVAGCSGQWCQVTYQGQSGYVIATSLGQGGPGGPPPGAPPPPGAVAAYPPGYGPPPVYVAPPPYYGPYYYGYGPYYRGYYGGGWRGGYRRW